jgi:carbon-monoxide dehydrogenase small subunit
MVMAAVSLLRETPQPDERQVREGLEGNFCRCTGYHNIVRAVLAAAGTDQPVLAAASTDQPVLAAASTDQPVLAAADGER